MNPIYPFVLSVFLFFPFRGKAQTAARPLSVSAKTADTLVVSLDTITVIANEQYTDGTASGIRREAIEHIQAHSLADVLQLLPGNTLQDNSLTTPRSLAVRDFGTAGFAANSFGTALYLDGMPWGNNAVLPFSATFSNRYPSTYSGVDIRSLSPEQIESVEVIRGVPSVKYGDLTSGAVLVRTRREQFPYAVKLKLSPTVKSLSAMKGWHLPRLSGTLNGEAHYTNAYNDLRTKNDRFDRFGLHAAYSSVLRQVTLNLDWRSDFAREGFDRANAGPGEHLNRSTGLFALQASGDWRVGGGLFSALSYHLSVAYTNDRIEECTYSSGVANLYSPALESGEHEAVFLPSRYLSEVTVENRPLQLRGQLTARLGNTRWGGLAGLEWRYEKNLGAGEKYGLPGPPVVNLEMRPRDFSVVPALSQGGAFVESSGTAGGFRWKVGVRGGLVCSGEYRRAFADPRVNASYRVHPSVRLRAAWGILHKVPSLSFLYPRTTYQDTRTFFYDGSTTGGDRLALISTQAIEPDKPSMRLAYSRKAEVGLDVMLGGFRLEATAFYEYLRHGYGAEDTSFPATYRVYDALTEPGQHPVFDRGVLQNGGKPVGYYTNTAFYTRYGTGNTVYARTRGIEYVLNCGEWEALRSSLVVNGAWGRVKTENRAKLYLTDGAQTGGLSYPYLGIFENPAGGYVGTRFNSNFCVVTRLPFLRLVTTLTLQAVWIDKRHFSWTDNPAQEPERRTENGIEYFYFTPSYYMDGEGMLHPFPAEVGPDSSLGKLKDVLRQTARYYRLTSFAPYFLLNLRVSKSIGKHVTLSFVANNLTDAEAYRTAAYTGGKIKLNPGTYVGLEAGVTF